MSDEGKTHFAKAAIREIGRLQAQLTECRDKALEEAAQACDKYPHYNWASENADVDHIQSAWGRECAHKIRSLKGEKP